MTGTDPAAVAEFIGNQRIEHRVPHRLAYGVLGVSESWFCKWSDRPTTAREVRRGQLPDAIRQIFEGSGGTCGSPKVWLVLVREGWRVFVNAVARLMAGLGLTGRKIRRRRELPRPGRRPAFPDFVRRDYTADAADQVWCGDMTEITTGEGKLYLATVIDMFSRRLLGHATGTRHDAELVVASLDMAAATRGGDVKGVIFNSDCGSEYGSSRFRRACRRLGVTQSMGRVGSCFDNAVSEAFNSVLKIEYVHRYTFTTRTEARLRIATWITGFYNTHRLHSVCGYLSPVDYEYKHRANSALELPAY
ncbi:IS3 family transposase [Streptomyces sp. NPDC093970]|uniref:IS3 family transposase n=1 Tax=Streptomyces sp. NPDC093970 TaxID=3155076 RepID=UPI003424E06F